MFDPMKQVDDLLAECQTLLSPQVPDLGEIDARLEQARLIISDAQADQARYAAVPAVVKADDSALEVARVFSVQGHFLAAVRWLPGFGPGHWGAVCASIAGAMGQMAEGRGVGAADDVARDIADACIDHLESCDVHEQDEADTRPMGHSQ